MAYTRDQALTTHKDYQETINNWEYYIRSYNGGYDYMIGQYLNRYNLELDNEFNQRLAILHAIIIVKILYKFIHLFYLELDRVEILVLCKMKLV